METLLSSSRSQHQTTTSSKLAKTVDDSYLTHGLKNFRYVQSGAYLKQPSPMAAILSKDKKNTDGIKRVQDSLSQTTDSSDENDSFTDSAIDEVPIWVQGEQRWISGITKDTTCAKLVDALLRDQGLRSVSAPGTSTVDQTGHQYVITERWKRVEQALDHNTKVLKIWNAWGETKPEVRLCLRRLDQPMPNSASNNSNNNNDHGIDNDSGRESPSIGANSAIVRRKRHRTSKASPAWVTHAQTIHPKSSKAYIEKLMKLILEQGETIQHQLARLRDREHQISKLEEDRHHMRERKHGKNYLLETYLNGLHEADDKEITVVNSDSGVHTENATPTPEVSASPANTDEPAHTDSFTLPGDVKPKTLLENASGNGINRRKSDRETKLLREHEGRKEYCEVYGKTTVNSDGSNQIEDATNLDDNVADQIEMLEKVVTINKHIQREEELLVRLNAKIRRYQSDNPAMTEEEVYSALDRVNGDIATVNNEMEKMEHELDMSNEMLVVKTDIVKQLSQELEALEMLSTCIRQEINEPNCVQIHTEAVMHDAPSTSRACQTRNAVPSTVAYMDPQANPDRNNVLNEQINFYKNMLPNINGFEKASLATVPLPPSYMMNMNDNHVGLGQVPQFFQKHPTDVDRMNSLQTSSDQRNLNTNAATVAKCIKIGPKKLIGLNRDQDSDTGVSSLGEDASQLGTLV